MKDMSIRSILTALALIVIPAIVAGQVNYFSSQHLEKYVAEPDANPVRTVTNYVKSPDGKTITDSSTYSAIVQKNLNRPGDLQVPIAFSPDGDGKDDQFAVTHPGLKDMFIFVYNAKGELVFESSKTLSAWDGTTGNSTCGEGSYVYFIKAKLNSGEYIRQKGAISLIRN